jgi:hypothetical protein
MKLVDANDDGVRATSSSSSSSGPDALARAPAAAELQTAAGT